jgi:hypothetical protein
VRITSAAREYSLADSHARAVHQRLLAVAPLFWALAVFFSYFNLIDIRVCAFTNARVEHDVGYSKEFASASFTMMGIVYHKRCLNAEHHGAF